MPGYCYKTHNVYGRVSEHPSSSTTLQQRKANELWLENIFSMLDQEGYWTWIDQNEIYTKDGNKITCNKKAYNKLALIVNNKWLCKKVRVK